VQLKAVAGLPLDNFLDMLRAVHVGDSDSRGNDVRRSDLELRNLDAGNWSVPVEVRPLRKVENLSGNRFGCDVQDFFAGEGDRLHLDPTSLRCAADQTRFTSNLMDLDCRSGCRVAKMMLLISTVKQRSFFRLNCTGPRAPGQGRACQGVNMSDTTTPAEGRCQGMLIGLAAGDQFLVVIQARS
jgi:hypothetical protein